MKNRNNKKEKINFKQKKENTICSLFEVEKFLQKSSKIFKGIKISKIIK